MAETMIPQPNSAARETMPNLESLTDAELIQMAQEMGIDTASFLVQPSTGLTEFTKPIPPYISPPVTQFQAPTPFDTGPPRFAPITVPQIPGLTIPVQRKPVLPKYPGVRGPFGLGPLATRRANQADFQKWKAGQTQAQPSPLGLASGGSQDPVAQAFLDRLGYVPFPTGMTAKPSMAEMGMILEAIDRYNQALQARTQFLESSTQARQGMAEAGTQGRFGLQEAGSLARGAAQEAGTLGRESMTMDRTRLMEDIRRFQEQLRAQAQANRMAIAQGVGNVGLGLASSRMGVQQVPTRTTFASPQSQMDLFGQGAGSLIKGLGGLFGGGGTDVASSFLGGAGTPAGLDLAFSAFM